jgi:hypothetical protein
VTSSFGTPPLSAGATSSASIVAFTEGLPQVGSIQFGVETGTSHDDFGASLVITDGVHYYDLFGSAPSGACNIGGCRYVVTLPFDLGTDFQVLVGASAAASISSPGGSGQQAASTVSFNLFDARGDPVAFSLVPEPPTWLLSVLGLSAAGWSLTKRYRSRASA